MIEDYWWTDGALAAVGGQYAQAWAYAIVQGNVELLSRRWARVYLI